MIKDNMKPIDVGAPVLIPQGDLQNTPGSYSYMKKILDDKKLNGGITSRTSTNKDFKPGYDTPGLSGDWQSTTIK